MGFINISLWFEPISWTLLILLILWFTTGVYMIYDIRYMEIPDQILVPAIVFYIILFILWYFSEQLYLHLFDAWSYQDFRSFIIDHLRSACIIYTFFFLQILLPGGWYLIRIKKYRELGELLLSYFTFPLLLITGRYTDTPEKDEIELPSWIGWGDLRVALFVGLTLGTIHTLSTLLFAYCIGAIAGIILLLHHGSAAKSQIPFGPFLWIGWILSLIFYTEILNFI
jgi:prepilin signal peptidase PulO-like enzyme (type II secretory pathway)